MKHPTQTRRRPWLILPTVVATLALTSTMMVTPVKGQRAIASLGSRVNKNGSSHSSKDSFAVTAGTFWKGLWGGDGDGGDDDCDKNDPAAATPKKWQRFFRRQHPEKAEDRRVMPPVMQSHLLALFQIGIMAITIVIFAFLQRLHNRRSSSSVSSSSLPSPSSRTTATSSSMSTARTASISTSDENIVIHDDELKATEGLNKVDLGFRGMRLEVPTKKSKSNKAAGAVRVVLDGSIAGRAQPGRMLAIMGPSGAGKSTVLHALAGRIPEMSKQKLFGERFLNGEKLSGDSMIPSAFVAQEMNFFPHMTVRETLHFRVELKLGNRLKKSARDAIVEELLDQMNLHKAADTNVGDAKVRGISGGERRRLSIACELVSSPSILFLDEPTSGLDSTGATAVVETLRKLADTGKTVIAVIHQPSQHVFASFDDLLLVSEGKQMYFGEVSKVRSYFEASSCKAPAEMGTAEHIIDCISMANLPKESDEAMQKRMDKLSKRAAESKVDVGVKDDSNSKQLRQFKPSHHGGMKANIFTQFNLLLRRSLRENFRGKTRLIITTVQQVTLSVIYGGIYHIGRNQGSIQDRFGLLSLIAIGAANMAIASTIRTFTKEKAIVSNEIGAKMYDTLPYFVGKALSEIPQVFFFQSMFGLMVSFFTGLNNSTQKLKTFLGILSMHSVASQSVGLLLGAVSPNSDTALALFPAVLVLNIIFDGRNISEENTPRLLRWLPKLGLIRWGFEGLAINEFEGLTFDADGARRGPVAKTGLEALSRFGLDGKNVGTALRAQLYITSACWFLSYVGLTLTRQKYEVMEPPKPKEESK